MYKLYKNVFLAFLIFSASAGSAQPARENYSRVKIYTIGKKSPPSRAWASKPTMAISAKAFGWLLI